MNYKIVLVVLSITAVLFAPHLVQGAGTTELCIVKYAQDETTVLDEVILDYQWMMDNLPIYGDGETHYYLQGPIFEGAWSEEHSDEPYDPWNPQEDVNVLKKDLGAVRGSNLRDLCDLVGGMSSGDDVIVKAADGFYKTFPYANVYEPSPRQGIIIVAWYSLDAYENGEMGGYVSDDYYDGMRLAFLADDSTNPWGKHVFGIEDMRACFAEENWHYYRYPNYPSTTGYSVKYIDGIFIHSSEDAEYYSV